MRETLLALRVFVVTILTAPVKTKVWHIALSFQVACLAAFLIGWMLFGWLVFPVQWQPDRLNSSSFATKVVYVHLISEWYAYSGNDAKAHAYLDELNNADEIACSMANNEQSDLALKARLLKVAYLVNGYGCLPE